MTFGIAGGAGLMAGLGSAQASHYRLPIKDRPLVTAAELQALGAAGIQTTQTLFERAAAAADRATLSRSTGISVSRLTTLACQTDLMRVSGIGPSMMKLLQTGGVMHSRDLRASGVDELHTRLKAANSVHRVTDILPQPGILEDWIAQARQLPQRLEGVQ